MRSISLLLWICVSVAACTDLADDSAVNSPNNYPPQTQVPTDTPTQPFEPVAIVPPQKTPSQQFVLASADPFSSFAAHADTASYDLFRRSLMQRALPNPGEVRAEEYTIYFRYDYQTHDPISDLPFIIPLSAGRQLT